MLKEIRKIIDNSLVDLKIENNLQYTVEIPPASIDADLSINIALLLSKKLKRNPKEIATEIIEKIKINNIISDAIFQSGFININLSEDFLFENLKNVILDSTIKTLNQDNIFNNKKILIEFVSANPTGPLHIGHGRGAAFGDSLARIFEFMGARVEREYYVNDMGNQMEVLAKSVLSYINNEPLPENGYKGKYIEEIAKEIQDTRHRVIGGQAGYSTRDTEIKEYTINRILEWIKSDLERFNIKFNNWFKESSLYKMNEVDKIIEELLKRGFAYKNEGAVWFKSTEFSDDKDRVIVREDGRKTYLASDIAYHYNKYQRNFDVYINIWGADHHGYVERMKGAIKAIGYDETKLKIILYQLVNIIKSGKKVTMSTRSGEFITLKEVLDEVGVDAPRFSLLMRNSESHLDFDLDLAIKQTPENPVFYVQYAHARICSIFREAEKKNTGYPPPSHWRASRIQIT